MKVLGYDLAKHTNVMASIHSVLKRLAETPDVKFKELRQVPGQRRYYWVANFAEPTETLRIQDTINASMETANAVVIQRAHLDSIAARIAASGVSAPPAVLIGGCHEGGKKK